MVLRCSCYEYTEEFYDNAILRQERAVRDANTLGQAASIVYKETHPIIQKEDGRVKVGCGGCVPAIKERIIALELRPAEEFNRRARFEPAKTEKCETCPNKGACKTISFDL